MDYKKAKLEIIEFKVEDVISTSSENNNPNVVEDFADGEDL